MIDEGNLDGPGTWGEPGDWGQGGDTAGKSDPLGDKAASLRDALNAIAEVDDVATANAMTKGAEKLARSRGISIAKATAAIALSMVSGNPVTAALGIAKGAGKLKDIDQAIVKEAEEIAANIVKDGNLDQGRISDIAKAMDTLSRSQSKSSATAVDNKGDEGGNDFWSSMLDDDSEYDGDKPSDNEEQQPVDTSPTSGNYQYNMDDPQMMEEFINTFMSDAYDQYKKRASGVIDATKKFQDTTKKINAGDDAAMSDYNARSRLLYDDMNNRQGMLYKDMNNRQGMLYDNFIGERDSYIDDLIAALDANANDKLPTVKRQVGSQTYEWIPKPNRAAANDARNTAFGLFDKTYGASKDTWTQGSDVAHDIWSKGSDIAQDVWAEGNDTAKNLFNADTDLNTSKYSRNADDLKSAIAAAMQGDGTLDYVSALAALADMENKRSATDKGISAENWRTQVNAEQNEPGIVDIFNGINTILPSVDGIVDSVVDWFI